MTFENFKNIIPLKTNEKYYVIGGSEIYKLFLTDPVLRPSALILTHIKPDISKDIDVFMNPDLITRYELSGYSEEIVEDDLKYRYIYYKLRSGPSQEMKYTRLIDDILCNGNHREDRTNTGTISVFGRMISFDISNSIPLITQKRISFKNILEELLWFCRGETDSNILKDKGVNIWNGNTTRDFLDARGLNDYQEGECGPIYGAQWRRFGESDTQKGVDQLKYVEHLLKTDPFSRRILISAWNPVDLNKMCLTPCHYSVQWYVEIVSDKKILNCKFDMRSSDFALAGCYNIVSYSILTYILAAKCDMTPGRVVYSVGDCHVYKTHLLAIKESQSRIFRPAPALVLNSSVKLKDWKDISFEDFQLIGYFPHPSVKMAMAV
jgi:thymidylate synthase